MAQIHRTTLTPGKLDLLTEWLPTRPWYVGGPARPELAKAGGFRLDDPAGEVGIEIMVVTDTSAAEVVAYLVPLTYRGAPLAGAEAALIGTSEHGVLGTRFVYDGASDPVFVAQLVALLQADVVAQHQSESDTPDPTVAAVWDLAERVAIESSSAVDVPAGTDIVISSSAGAALTLHVVRRLGESVPTDPDTRTVGRVTAARQAPDGTTTDTTLFLVSRSE